MQARTSFEAAARYFKNHPDSSSLEFEAESHAFIKLNQSLYAVDKTQDLGRGSYGQVNIVHNEQGERFAMKVETLPKHLNRLEEQAILHRLNELVDVVTVPIPKDQQFKDAKGRTITKKVYTVMSLKQGRNLAEYLEQFEVGKHEVERLWIALLCAVELERLHFHDIVHCDLKPENFILDNNEHGFDLATVDYGFGLRLFGLEAVSYYKHRGSPKYMAPELNPMYLYRLRKYRKGDIKQRPKRPDNLPLFSKPSDIFAMGVMFEKDIFLGLDKEKFKNLFTMIRDMRSKERSRRPDINSVINTLITTLKTHKRLQYYPNIKLALKSLSDKIRNNNAEVLALKRHAKQQRLGLWLLAFGVALITAVTLIYGFGHHFFDDEVLWFRRHWLGVTIGAAVVVAGVANVFFGWQLVTRRRRLKAEKHCSIAHVWEQMVPTLPEVFPQTIEDMLQHANEHGIYFENKLQVKAFLEAVHTLIQHDFIPDADENIYHLAAKYARIKR